MPVVSTDVGGVPFLVEHGRTAWLVPAGVAASAGRWHARACWTTGACARTLDAHGARRCADRCAWPVVRDLWLTGCTAAGAWCRTECTRALQFAAVPAARAPQGAPQRRAAPGTGAHAVVAGRAQSRQLQVAAAARVPDAAAGRTCRTTATCFGASASIRAASASLADLQALPFLDKPTIRANTEALKSDAAGKLIRYNTGGSSGEPLVFYMGMGRVSHDVAAKWRATRWWGVDIGDPEVVLWGSPIEIGKQDRIKAVRDRLFRSHLLPAFQMSDAQMDRYLDAHRRLRPRMLFGYASALALLATHAERRGRDMRGLGVKVAFTTGETLYPGAARGHRAGVRRAGGERLRVARCRLHRAPVPERLAAPVGGAHHRRTGRRGGAAGAPGEKGEIVVTHLATGDFPFIRYRTGDMAVIGRRALCRAAAACRC